MRLASLLLCGLFMILSCADGDIADHLKSRITNDNTTTTATPTTATCYSNNNDGSWYPDTSNIVISDATLAAGENLLNSNETQLCYAYVIFNLSSLGLAADDIVSVTLSIYRGGSQGDPSLLGSLYVDHVSSPNTNSTPPVEDNFYTFSVPADMTWTTFTVTNQVKTDLLAGRTTTAYMIGFSGYVSNSQYDVIYFNSYENSNQPYLTITYQ